MLGDKIARPLPIFQVFIRAAAAARDIFAIRARLDDEPRSCANANYPWLQHNPINQNSAHACTILPFTPIVRIQVINYSLLKAQTYSVFQQR